LISDDHPRDVPQALEQFAEEFLGGLLVPPALHQDIKHMAVLIHRTPEKVTFAVDGQKYLIQMPRISGSKTPATELIGIHLPEFSAPIPYRFVRQEDAAGGHRLFDVAVAEAEADGEPYTVVDDLCGEPMTLVGARYRLCMHVASMPHEAGAGKVGKLI
jgi:hypothetical protein